METRCVSASFWLYLLLSLTLHLAELSLSALQAFALYRDFSQRDVMFSLTAGLIILPLVLVQLLSAIFLLRRRGDAMTGREAAWMGALHVLQLAFVWRHVTLLRKHAAFVHQKKERNELRELFVLRLVFTFTGGFPLVLSQLYLLMIQAHLGGWSWVLYASLAASAISCTYSTCTCRWKEPQEDMSGADGVWLKFAWPGSLLLVLWRVGEMASRTIVLALFASLYGPWIFLVLGFHWIFMFVCLSLPQTASQSLPGVSGHRAALCLMTSYSFVWCYISVSDVKRAIWYTLYYVITFLELCTLSIVWLIESNSDTLESRYLLVVISALSFIVSMACLLVSYRHFHLHVSSVPDQSAAKPEGSSKEGTAGVAPAVRRGTDTCAGCQQGFKHAPRGRYSAGWMSQYHTALTAGQYYKHTMQDSLLDSASDMTSVAMGGRCQFQHHHHRSHQQQDGFACSSPRGKWGCACLREGEGDGVSMTSYQTSRSAHSCPQRRCLKASRSDLTDTTSVVTMASGVSHNLGYEGSDDTQSATVPAWLPAGDSLIARHLLTPDTCIGSLGERAPGVDKEHRLHQERSMEHYRSLLKQEAQRWADTNDNNDGYGSDHTVLQWSKLPVTMLTNNVWDVSDPDSDCAHGGCCCCCHQCQHHQHQQQLSPGDSEVSSIFRAAQGCEECGRCGEDGGGADGVYGVPSQPVQLQGKTRPKDPMSSDSEATCSCCAQQQVTDGRKLHCSQPSVFTISQPQSACCESGGPHYARGGDRQQGRRCVSDEEGASCRKQECTSKKSKRTEKRKQREYSGGRSSKDTDRSTDTLVQTVGAAPVKTAQDIRQAHSAKATSSKPLPSKLQVKAIAEKSDDDSTTKSSPTASVSPSRKEPIYENVKLYMQETKPQKSHSSSTSNKTDETFRSVLDEKAAESLEQQQNGDNSTRKSNKNKDRKDSSKSKGYREDKSSIRKEETTNKHKAVDRRPKVERLHKKWNSRQQGDSRHSVAAPQDAWYVCSESEDSALPPETFSSSVDDGFTASDVDSESGSIELVI